MCPPYTTVALGIGVTVLAEAKILPLLPLRLLTVNYNTI